MNTLWRIAYYLAHRLMRFFMFVTGFRPRGAFVAIWHGREILILKTSYQPFYAFPGGIAHRREEPRANAVREVAEEIGVALDPAALEPITRSPLQAKLDRDHVALFAVHLAAAPAIREDGREIVWAGFVPVNDPRIASLWLPFRAYVQAQPVV